MAIFASPNVVSDGLILCLDAGNSKTFSGSGTTLNNLLSSSSTSGTLTNGPIFDSANQGSFFYDGINDYTVINTSLNNSFTEFTVEIIFKTPVAGNSGTAFLLWDHSSGYPIWLGKSQSNQWYWFWNFNASRGKSAQISSASYTANSWIHIAVRCYMSNTTRLSETNNFAELIVNGTNYSTTHRNDNDTALNYPSGSIWLARRGTAAGNGELGGTVSDYANVNISVFRIYNRVLSREEILRNYNASRERFGI